MAGAITEVLFENKEVMLGADLENFDNHFYIRKCR